MVDIPRSLQAMIADARRAVEHWEDDDQDAADDEIREAINASKEWAVRLSRGEYEEDLYWECVAEDCESAGDWDAAKAAYLRMIELEANGLHGFSSAHSYLAGIHYLLGEQQPALNHARRATNKEQRDRLGGIAFRCAVVHEAWLLLRAGRVRAARRLIKRGLWSFEEDSPDALGYAKLQTAWAACDVAARRAASADEPLQDAWTYLESIRESLNVDGSADTASGLQSAYATWWRVEAQRRRLAGEGEAEIEAWEHAVASARRAAAGWERVGCDAAVMRALRSLGEAERRHGQVADAAKTQAAAEAIRLRWHLPAVGLADSGDDLQLCASPRSRVRRLLQALFRQRR